MAAVYDKEKTDDDKPLKSGSGSGKHDDMGVHPERREAETDELDKLYNAKSAKKSGSDIAAERNRQADEERKKLDDQVGEGFKPEAGSPSKKRKKFFLSGPMTRNKAGILGGLGLGIGFTFWGFTITQGPLQLIHFSQLLQGFHLLPNEEFSEGRLVRHIRNMKSGQAQRSRMGQIGNRYADRIEKRMNNRSGLRSVYDGTTGNFLGYEIVDPAKARDQVRDFRADNIPVQGQAPGFARGPNGEAVEGLFVNFTNQTNKVKKYSIKTVMDANRIGRFTGIPARVMITRAGVDFHPLKNVRRKAGQKLVDYWRERKEERAKRRAQGVDAPDKRLNHSQEGNDFANEAKDADTPEKKVDLVNKLLKGGGIVAAFVQSLCIIYSLSKDIDVYQYENILLPMMRMGLETIALGDQIKSSGLSGLVNADVNMDEVGSFATDTIKLYEGKKVSWSAAKSINSEVHGGPGTGPDLPPEAQVARVGQKNAVFRFIDQIPVLGTLCGLIDSALDAIPIVGDVLNLVSSITEGVINSALAAVGIASIEELYMGVVGVLSGGAVNMFAQGPDWGNIANVGAKLFAKDAIAAMGGVPLTAAQSQRLEADAKSALAYEHKKKSFFARTFDVMDANSMVSTAMRDMPQSPNQMIASLFSAPARFASSLFRPVSAQTVSTYDYNFDDSGFTIEEQNDPRFENPYANEEIVLPQIADLNNQFGECFNTEIVMTPENKPGLQMGQSLNINKIPDVCNRVDANNNNIEDREMFLRFRFYLADVFAEHSLACAEKDQASCLMIVYGQN